MDVSQVDGDNRSPVIYRPVSLNGVMVDMEVDTGAAVSLMTEEQFHELGILATLTPHVARLKTYSGGHVPVVSRVELDVELEGKACTLPLLVVKGYGPPLLGRNWMGPLGLEVAQIHSVKTAADWPGQFPEVFAPDLGMMDQAATLHLRENVAPQFRKSRPVPYAMQEAVAEELVRLEWEGAIEKVSYSEWATPIVSIPKADGTVRLCGDYKVTLNPALVVDHHPLPRAEDLFHKVRGCSVFSTLDLSKAYQQMPPTPECRDLTTINTPLGLYWFTRLPFGVASALAIFQCTMEQILEGTPGVEVFIDDVLVAGQDQAEHDQRVMKALERLQQHGLRVRADKCSFSQSSVTYLGHLIDAEGLHVTPKRIEAVQAAPRPENIQQLKSFLGMMAYNARFLPHLASMLEPLHALTRKNTPWKWSAACEDAFKACKEALTGAPVLGHYDPALDLRLAVDASPYELGAVLCQVSADGKEQLISYASRSLSPAERNYAQLDREALAIVFGVKQFHRFLFGQHFTLVTDHKPLTAIFSPDKATPCMAAARLQRWPLVLSAYSYSIEHTSGSRNCLADAMSRLPLPDSVDRVALLESIFYVQPAAGLPVTAQQIANATRRDPLQHRCFAGYNLAGQVLSRRPPNHFSTGDWKCQLSTIACCGGTSSSTS